MTVRIIYDELSERFDSLEVPLWYDDAVLRLRGGADRTFGLYLYNLVRQTPSIETIVNVGTARGFSAVCLARAIIEREAPGVVHTIDIQSPDRAKNWHAREYVRSDPTCGEKLTVRELIAPFEPAAGSLPIRHHTGDSLDVLDSWDDGSIDLMFLDGRHTYDHVESEIDLALERSGDGTPYLIFDDCFLYENEWTRWLVTDRGILEYLNSVPGLRRLPEYAVVRKRSAGVARAVAAAFEKGPWSRLEVVNDDWAPITTLVGRHDGPDRP